MPGVIGQSEHNLKCVRSVWKSMDSICEIHVLSHCMQLNLSHEKKIEQKKSAHEVNIQGQSTRSAHEVNKQDEHMRSVHKVNM